MPIHIVRLGSPRTRNEGTRIGTVRRPPRGVPRTEFARRDFYDVWFPLLAPSPATMQFGLQAETAAHWQRFVRSYTAEMQQPEARRALDLLAALSHTGSFAVGCYCADEARCHRSILRQLLAARGALLA